MAITLDDSTIEQLMAYLGEFDKWNKAYNLSAIRKPIEMVERHLLDSLALVPILRSYLKNNQESKEQDSAAIEKIRIIDVGTGGGLPGIPLSIVFPDIDFTLLDSNGKKTRFLFQVKTLLKLGNVTIENRRVEAFVPEQMFDIVVSRAFASLNDMVVGTAALLKTDGYYWAMKGIYPENELRDCEKHAIVESAISLDIPEQQGERHLLILKPNNNQQL